MTMPAQGSGPEVPGAAPTQQSPSPDGYRSGPTWPAGRRTGRRNWTCPSGSTPTRTPTRRHRRWSRRSRCRGRGGGRAQPLPRPGRDGAAGRPRRLSGPRPDRAAVVGGQRLQRDHPAVAAGIRRLRRSALGFEPSYAMHPLISRATGTRWISGSRDADFGLNAAGGWPAIGQHRPDLVFLTSPNNPTGHRTPAGRDRGGLRRSARHGRGRRGLRRVRQGRRGHGAGPAAALPAPGGHPDHVQGVRPGRRADRLPRRGTRG